jgi:PKHD-type hydroxylase
MLQIRNVLTPDQVDHCRQVLKASEWIDGRVTAGPQSGRAKRNLQLPEAAPEAAALGELVLGALAAHPHFLSAALPLRVFPPLFNLYGEGMGFGDHIDNAIRVSTVSGARYRTDLSGTLFLSAPEDYDGGELVVGDDLAAVRVKLPAGDLVLYDATTIHRVEPVTRGTRWACFFWVQSMVADSGRRSLLYQLDQATSAARAGLGDGDPAAISLVGVYHNLVRMWAEV